MPPRVFQNREAFDEAVGLIVAAPRGPRRGALLVLEIDDFDGLADTRGSRYAEGVAATIVRLVAALLRAEDCILGQPEGRALAFVVGPTGEDATRIAERLCAAVRLHAFAETDRGPSHRVTCSIGVAALPDHGAGVASAYGPANAACARIAVHGKDGAGLAPRAHHT
ncbi:MAG TPA: diguanylate cyclase, partial [Gemmatimonadaceae bacterium]|nr:diguanylate cyclase [Gemmatimonadaceae bacterium]